MGFFQTLLANLPEIKAPDQKLGFKDKLLWTLLMLVAFFVLSVIPLYGLGENALAQFEQLSIILGASFGSILSLGIGPIVTASIVLQLLSGSGILKIDNTTHEGRVFYQGLQKFAAIFFILFEATVYVFLGGLAPAATLKGTSGYFTLQIFLVVQLMIGGLLVLFMDEVVSKWGFGSGISLFIAAGVSSELVIRIFSPLNSLGQWAFGSGQAPIGALLVFFSALVSGAPGEAFLAFAGIFATLIVFVMAVYAQSMKIEIPLSFERYRGFGYRWPLPFLYTSNIPVIIVESLLANIQLWARFLQNWGHPLLGTFVGQNPATGLVVWLNVPRLITNILTGVFQWFDLAHALVYLLFLVVGSVVFSIFWVQTSGMDAAGQARQIMAAGLQIPGFRRDPRVLEHVLKRYIFPLTVMGGITIGFLAGTADVLGALSRGTGILLSVMIIYRLYEDIAKQHMVDMHPALRKFMGGS
ncbi:preprotein translocase subunit SecY [Candidatus Woesearchaeota archaeon]|nr:preprotein translocase subunit SecY [Candidatus Woesearchaeota archaeon]